MKAKIKFALLSIVAAALFSGCAGYGIKVTAGYGPYSGSVDIDPTYAKQKK